MALVCAAESNHEAALVAEDSNHESASVSEDGNNESNGEVWSIFALGTMKGMNP